MVYKCRKNLLDFNVIESALANAKNSSEFSTLPVLCKLMKAINLISHPMQLSSHYFDIVI